ncbi:MAG: hypothetical protein IIZ12_01395 [Eggerthellaceae bacterium]|nr:hypothetical protein [Eggerthellaceae bacterium]
MASGVRVEMNFRGVREILNDAKVISDLERRGKSIAREATGNALKHYDDLGYDDKEIFVTKTTKTAKHGNDEVIVFANPGIHAGEDGKPIGDYAQARHSSLTQAIDAGRS